MAKSWDDFDRLGREHHRLARSAETHLKEAYKKLELAKTDQQKEEARRTVEAWSLTHARHSRELRRLQWMKYRAATTIYGPEGWEIVHDPKVLEEEQNRRKKRRESAKDGFLGILQGY